MDVENRFDAIVRNIYIGQLKKYEAARKLKENERKSLREWVADYNSVYSNPFHVYDSDGNLMDYISAYRRCLKEHKATLRKELKEYELSISGLTDEERHDLREWVADGNSVYDNPYHMVEEDGTPVDYIEAIRTTAELMEMHHKSLMDTDGEIPL